MNEINNENKYLSLEEKSAIINDLVSFGFSLEDSESIVFYSKDWLEKLKCQNQLSITYVTSKLKYLVDVFIAADNFIKFVKEQQYSINYRTADLIDRKYTIFDIEPKEMVEEKVSYIERFFSISREEMVKKLCENPSWFFHSIDYFNSRIANLVEFFEKDRETIIKLVYDIPFVLGKRLTNVTNRVEYLAKYFNVNSKKIKDMFFEYPALLNYGVSFFTERNLTSIIFEKKWLLECIIDVKDCNFAGYPTFDELYKYIEFVEKYFGVVEKLIRKKYKEGTFFALITNNNNKKYAFTIGGGFITPTGRILSSTEKMLRSIFNNNQKLISEYCCLINDDAQDYLDYVEEVLLIVAINKCDKITLKPNNLILKRKDDVLSKDIDDILEVAPAYSQFNAVCVEKGEIIVKSMTKKQEEELEKDFGDDFNFDDIDDFE